MGEMTSDSASASAGIDLSQFYGVFFEEAGDNLDMLERQLLELDVDEAGDEELNAIFRCAHSIKGGAATFGFADVAELTHQMETLLDKLRRHELAATAPMVDALLQSGDALRAQLARHQNGGGVGVDTAHLLVAIRAFVAGEAPAVQVQMAAPASAPPATNARGLEVIIGPLQDPSLADNIIELFAEIPSLGAIEVLDGGHAADGVRRFKITTTSSDDDLLDLFTFHVDRSSVKLVPIQRGYGFYEGAPGAPKEAAVDDDYGFFDNNPGAPVRVGDTAPAGAAASAGAGSKPAARAADARQPAADAATLRVSVDKVDQLINLVGELVITQAMLAQTSANLDPSLHEQMSAGLADLERNTRDLQESVMSIRMIPMSVVFNRFPRMLRDLAAKLDKKVEFVTQGEATELDKGLVEKITDPLTHLVRNSCDHGIELPAERKSRNKPETGTITLAASHQGGSIVIEVRDDGKGLSRGKLIKKARERGIAAPDSMTDAEVWGLIFEPGFSTAEVVTDVSGRGVGMDVVKRNITALGGSVEIDSAEGLGMKVSVRLPLTLAIMDSMSVGVGGECYILPLSSVVESFQLTPDKIRTVGGSARLVQVRDEYLPVVELETLFSVPRRGDEPPSNIMVVVEADGARTAVLVDELLGQQQVVVKNLESNYRKVDYVSGATIMGDGQVALILDVGAMVRRTRH